MTKDRYMLYNIEKLVYPVRDWFFKFSIFYQKNKNKMKISLQNIK